SIQRLPSASWIEEDHRQRCFGQEQLMNQPVLLLSAQSQMKTSRFSALAAAASELSCSGRIIHARMPCVVPSSLYSPVAIRSARHDLPTLLSPSSTTLALTYLAGTAVRIPAA